MPDLRLMSDVKWLSELNLSLQEQNILAELVDPDTEVRAVATDLGPEKLWAAIEVSLRVYSTVKRAQSQLKPVIGKLLIELEKYPQLYQSKGFSTYDEFLTLGAPSLLGIPRSEAYRAKRLAQTWPSLTPEEFGGIGEGKLYLLSSFTNSADPASEHWLDVARNSTKDQLRDAIVVAGEATAESITNCQIAINTSLDVKQAWSSFVSNPQVQSTVGSGDHGQILLAALGEASSSWGV